MIILDFVYEKECKQQLSEGFLRESILNPWVHRIHGIFISFLPGKETDIQRVFIQFDKEVAQTLYDQLERFGKRGGYSFVNFQLILTEDGFDEIRRCMMQGLRQNPGQEICLFSPIQTFDEETDFVASFSQTQNSIPFGPVERGEQDYVVKCIGVSPTGDPFERKEHPFSVDLCTGLRDMLPDMEADSEDPWVWVSSKLYGPATPADVANPNFLFYIVGCWSFPNVEALYRISLVQADPSQPKQPQQARQALLTEGSSNLNLDPWLTTVDPASVVHTTVRDWAPGLVGPRAFEDRGGVWEETPWDPDADNENLSKALDILQGWDFFFQYLDENSGEYMDSPLQIKYEDYSPRTVRLHAQEFAKGDPNYKLAASMFELLFDNDSPWDLADIQKFLREQEYRFPKNEARPGMFMREVACFVWDAGYIEEEMSEKDPKYIVHCITLVANAYNEQLTLSGRRAINGVTKMLERVGISPDKKTLASIFDTWRFDDVEEIKTLREEGSPFLRLRDDLEYDDTCRRLLQGQWETALGILDFVYEKGCTQRISEASLRALFAKKIQYVYLLKLLIFPLPRKETDIQRVFIQVETYFVYAVRDAFDLIRKNEEYSFVNSEMIETEDHFDEIRQCLTQGFL